MAPWYALNARLGNISVVVSYQIDQILDAYPRLKDPPRHRLARGAMRVAGYYVNQAERSGARWRDWNRSPVGTGNLKSRWRSCGEREDTRRVQLNMARDEHNTARWLSCTQRRLQSG